MRLLGVQKSTSIISSRLGLGGTTGGWIIEEFTAQMRAVSKIALHRWTNLATFLEMNGMLPSSDSLYCASRYVSPVTCVLVVVICMRCSNSIYVVKG